MKKPLLVVNLFFAGLIGVGLTRGTVMHSQNPVGMINTAGSVSQNGRGDDTSTNKTVAGSSNDPTTFPTGGNSSGSASSFLEESSCSTVKVEVAPCQ